MREQEIALVVADTAGKWPLIEDTTSDFVYVRLHGDAELYVSGYTALCPGLLGQEGAGVGGGPDAGRREADRPAPKTPTAGP